MSEKGRARLSVAIRMHDWWDGDINAFTQFMQSPQELLGGHTPEELIERGECYRIHQMIDQMEGGAFI